MDPFTFQFPKLVIVLLLTSSVFSYCYADQNQNSGVQCSSYDNSTTVVNPYQTDIDNVLNILSKNAPLHKGFYISTSGKINGLVQCRADISPLDCANCTKMCIQEAAYSCPQANDVTVWFRWCFLRYSVKYFYGAWDDDSLIGISFETRFDDLDTVSKGIELMSGLAATAPQQDSMVQTGIVDVGIRGKRYGMVQCTQDMSRSVCGLCLDAEVKFFKTVIRNSTNKDVFMRGCRMWYNDYQFYSNISTNGGKRSSMANKGVLAGMIFGALVLLSGL